jgi:hypothetical protein
MTPIIILVSAIFALAAIIGLIDLFVHAVCWSAQSLRTPQALEERRGDAVQSPAHGITA